MAKYLGIDIGSRWVRAVLVRSSYRRVTIEAMVEVERSSASSLAEVIRAVAAPLTTPGESVAVSLEGDSTFVRHIEIPIAAQKQLMEVLPFELEAELPFEIADAVYDHAVLRRGPDETTVPVFAVAARNDGVRARVDLVREAIGEEPERVVPGGLSLAALTVVMPEVGLAGPIALFDLEEGRSELVILERGEAVFARTLSRGTEGLPASAPLLARELRQTLAAFRAGGGIMPVVGYLVGAGAEAPGATAFFEGELAMPIAPLPPTTLDDPSEETLASLGRYAKALSLALSVSSRSRGFNLRRGSLAYERGYGFLRDKIPLLSGLAAVVVCSFFFSTWAELRALGQERVVLEGALAAITKDVFGEATSDPARATELLDKSASSVDEDPLPHGDAFDVMVQIAQAVPEGIAHDIEELDVQRGHVTLHGIVPSIPDAQQIATQLKSVRCFQDVKIVRTNQVLGEARQKYAMEFDIKCPNEGKEKPGAAAASSASASGGKP